MTTHARTSTAASTALDQAGVDAFAAKVLNDTAGWAATTMAAIGDRLGLFKDLAAHGPATSDELAGRLGINERYAREWLAAMTSAGYIHHDQTSGIFSLPPEHAPALAQEAGPVFFGGAHHTLLGEVSVIDSVIQSFRDGGGVPQSAYPDSTFDGMERFSAPWFENLLLQEWIPAMPEVGTKLEQGCRVADVGCGRGRALIKLAQAFPRSRYVGYDVYGPNVDRATANAGDAGVGDRVTFRQADVSTEIPGEYELITTFDVIHDAVDPVGILRAIRAALTPDGRYLCLEINCSEKLEENVGPLGTILYSVSVLYCMTTSLADGGEALGTAGLPESKLRELCREAGFGKFRRVPFENPFNVLYEIEAEPPAGNS